MIYYSLQSKSTNAYRQQFAFGKNDKKESIFNPAGNLSA